MSASDLTGDIQTLATADRELALAADMAHARICRLLEAGFSNPARALYGLEKLIQDHGVDRTISILQDDPGKRWSRMGFTRDNVLSLKRGPAREALAKLPDAIRERQQLADKLSDVRRLRALKLQQQRERAPARERTEGRAGQQRARRTGRK